MHARTIEGALLSNVLANEQFSILRGFQAKLSFSLTHFQFSYLDLGHRRMKHIEQYLITLHAGPARDNSSARSHSKFVCFGCFWQLTSPGSSWSANLWSHVFCGHPIVRCPEGLHFHSRRTQRCSGSIGSPCKDSPAQLIICHIVPPYFVCDFRCQMRSVRCPQAKQAREKTTVSKYSCLDRRKAFFSINNRLCATNALRADCKW